jgi:hypothetical protein
MNLTYGNNVLGPERMRVVAANTDPHPARSTF